MVTPTVRNKPPTHSDPLTVTCVACGLPARFVHIDNYLPCDYRPEKLHKMADVAVNVPRALKLLNDLARVHPDLEMTVRQSARGGLLAGIGAAVGGLLLGQKGILAGGALGGAVAMATSEDFKPVWKIVEEMSPSERRKLALLFVRKCAEFGINYLITNGDEVSFNVGERLLKVAMEAMGYCT